MTDDNTDPSTLPSDEVTDSLTEQATGLTEIHDHPVRIISNLSIDPEWFEGYDDPGRASDPLEPVVRMFLYQHTQQFNQSEVARRLNGAAFVWLRCGLSGPVGQARISYNWRNRFNSRERRCIKEAAARLRDVFEEAGLSHGVAPALEPEDIDLDQGIGADQVVEAVRLASRLGFAEFSAGRAANTKYPLEAFFERQGYLSLSRSGTTTPRRRFGYLSDRDEVPHGSTHNRTMKKVATPDEQRILSDFEGQTTPDWQRIRDTVLPAFHAGVEKQLDEIAGRDRQGLRQPVQAAIDITTINHWPSPYKDDDDVDWSEDPVTLEYDWGTREVYPREDYPEMVSGFKDSNKKRSERGYKFATLTVVAESTPIILGIEPVRDVRKWEKDDPSVTVEGTSRADIVRRLLDQAEQHVDIHKLFCDREFDIHEVRDVADKRSIQYVIGKVKRSSADFENIEEILDDRVYDSRIEHVWGAHDGREHKVSIVYLPVDDDESDGYSIFTVNGWVDPDRAQALTDQYRNRWTIENQYKSIKKHFLPSVASTDYRIRFLYFVIGVILHNVWRLVNFVIRDEADGVLGESPPIQAGEIVEVIGRYLFDPGE